LIDAVTGAHIWADRFERDLTDVFALQDEVTVAVVSAIQPKLLQTEIALAMRAAFSTAFILLAATGSSALAQKKYDTGATDTEIKIGNIMPYSGPSHAVFSSIRGES
jgi:hypothetical protein